MRLIRRVALRTPEIVGSPRAFFAAIVLAAVWIVVGPFVGFGDTWLLWPSAIASVVTFLIVFSLQYTQNRDTRAIQLKLDEILRATDRARTELVKLERLPDEELAQVEEEILELRRREADDESASGPRARPG
jgi:low affinity Fe/Cu permease